jgi:dihydroceramidase
MPFYRMLEEGNMIIWLPSFPYGPPQEGYWSPVSSTIDWCEENYYATIYSAEIVNTLTNLLFMYLGLRGALNCIQNGHDNIFLVTCCGYLIVGTGSFLFHSTLKCTYHTGKCWNKYHRDTATRKSLLLY